MKTIVSSMSSRFSALALSALLALPTSAALAAPSVKDSAASVSRTTELTERDVAASNDKVRMAYSDLAAMWVNGLARMRERFAVPRLLRYRGAARSACGIMQPNNATYCPNENAIYYDEVFVAAQAKAAALELGTDGDMAFHVIRPGTPRPGWGGPPVPCFASFWSRPERRGGVT